MTSKESAQDKELLERYRRASDTEAAAPSEAVRAAILAESRRVAELRAQQAREQRIDASRPAANDSRWKITAFGTAGAALVAALLFAPRLWESAPPAPSAGEAIVAESADKAAASSQLGAAQPPKLDSLRTSASEPLQEIVVTQAKRENSKAERAGAAGASTGRGARPIGRARTKNLRAELRGCRAPCRRRRPGAPPRPLRQQPRLLRPRRLRPASRR